MSREAFIAYTNRTDITEADLPQWFATVRDYLEAAYLVAETPWQQSGKSGTYEDWVRLRIPLSECITRDGSFLDIGCANGFLLQCLLTWISQKDVTIIPHGLDISEALVQRARDRLPQHAERIYTGNSWDWQPPQMFDYVHTGLEYVPVPFQRDYVRHLLQNVVAPDGVLIVAHYRSSREDLTTGWVDSQLREWGYTIDHIARGYSSAGLEQTRYAAIRNQK